MAQISICISIFLGCIGCVCACRCYFIRAPRNLNHTSLVLFSGADIVVSSLWGQLKKTKPPRKRSLSLIHPFHYELIWSIPLLFVCCTFKQNKPPEPPQDSKVSHTVQQGNHEAVKNNQIKARCSVLGIMRELLYYFTVVSAEIQMVVFIVCSVNSSLCLETFGRAPGPQIFRGIVISPCLLWVNRLLLSAGVFYRFDLITASLPLTCLASTGCCRKRALQHLFLSFFHFSELF